MIDGALQGAFEQLIEDNRALISDDVIYDYQLTFYGCGSEITLQQIIYWDLGRLVRKERQRETRDRTVYAWLNLDMQRGRIHGRQTDGDGVGISADRSSRAAGQ